MKCLDCISLDLRTFPKHATTGFGRCGHEKVVGVFESITKDRQCKMFVEADEAVTFKRRDWAIKNELL